MFRMVQSMSYETNTVRDGNLFPQGLKGPDRPPVTRAAELPPDGAFLAYVTIAIILFCAQLLLIKLDVHPLRNESVVRHVEDRMIQIVFSVAISAAWPFVLIAAVIFGLLYSLAWVLQ